MTREMTAADVVEIVELLEGEKISVWVDGGWGVDALLKRQTRFHSDLDIAIRHRDVAQTRSLLEARGFRDVPRDDTRECNFVLGDDRGREVDIHTFEFDENGNCIFGCAYPFDSLTGRGEIDGKSVDCISAEWLVKFHTGYPLDDDDFRDVFALCQRFQIPIPEDYAPWLT